MIEACFDTNILIDSLNGIETAQAELRTVNRRFISRISWIEVIAGIDAASAAPIERFLEDFTIIEINEIIARRAAAIRGEGGRLRLPDAIIWATAQTTGRILITRNTKDFPANMPGIRIPYQI